ncbi:hypothetical protein JVT61DRAFT_12420 [Boletus reticuloceps]|uniref:Uncharacterized protein n=1 Tax=Boletus reticuloceps TaxID=495285 RepID=A0A8I2YE15_9AGAM|nr:hypothetical protein JVT61DRAFT_12420 [Boletus reticuloceps]
MQPPLNISKHGVGECSEGVILCNIALEELIEKCQEEKASLDDLEEIDDEEVEGQAGDLAEELLDPCIKNDLAVFVDSILLQGLDEQADGPLSSLLQEAKQLEPDVCWRISSQKAQMDIPIYSSFVECPSNSPPSKRANTHEGQSRSVRKGGVAFQERHNQKRKENCKAKAISAQIQRLLTRAIKEGVFFVGEGVDAKSLPHSKSGWEGSTMTKKADKQLMKSLIDSDEIWDIFLKFVKVPYQQ